MNPKKILLITLLLLFLVGSMVLTIYAGEKVLKVSINSQSDTLDPHAERSGAAEEIMDQYFEALTRLEPDGRHVLELAESITEVDEATYEIKTREDVYFHNGDHMTADDVVFSLHRVGVRGGWDGQDSPKINQIGGPFESVEKIDKYTVRVKLESPKPLTQYANWLYGRIIPKSYFEKVDGIDEFIKKPVGTGAFKWYDSDFVSYFVFERNEDYWGGAPKIDRVIIYTIPEPATRLAAIMAGDVDIIRDLPLDMVPVLKANPNINVEPSKTANVVIMSINTHKPPLDDKRVRQALAYSIDYAKISQELTLGYGEPLYALPFLPPFEGTPGYGAFDHIQGYEYNPEKAKALLKEVGIDDGFSIVIDTIDHQIDKAQVIAQMWSDIGIDASVRCWDLGVLSATWREANHNRDVYLSRYNNMDRFPDYIANQVAAGRPQNRAGYVNSYVDELLAKVSEMEDSAERNTLFIELFEIVLDDLPCIFIEAQGKMTAWHKKIKNYVPCIRTYLNADKLDLVE